MFGFVAASVEELTPEEKQRYNSVYCGICRRIRSQSSNLSRLTLSYDTTFLALLLMSLYEPEETGGDHACVLHPIRKKHWVDNDCIRYAADMNVILAYYNALDDWEDDRRTGAKMLADILGKEKDRIEAAYPRQCGAIRSCLSQLSTLEKENCANPDLPAGCFGRLMGELLVWKEDLWSETLRQMGNGLGRFIYLADAADDFDEDARRGRFNALRAVYGDDFDKARREQVRVAMIATLMEAEPALALVPFDEDPDAAGIVRNTFFLGLPAVAEHILFPRGKGKGKGKVPSGKTSENQQKK